MIKRCAQHTSRPVRVISFSRNPEVCLYVLGLELDDKLEAVRGPLTVFFYPSDDQKSCIQTRLTEGTLRNHMQFEKTDLCPFQRKVQNR
jgi:hypothetical protein